MNLIDKIKVVVLDCYGTIVGYGVPVGEKQTARKGLIEFLNKCVVNDIKLVIATDDDNVHRVWSYLDEIGILQYFLDQPYQADEPSVADFNFYGLDKLDFTKHKYGDKDFARIAEDFGVTTDELYFVGDNGVGRDKRSAERYKVQWTNCEQYHPFAKFGDVYDFNQILEPFAWTDDSVKGFANFYTQGVGPRNIDGKLEYYKKLCENKVNTYMVFDKEQVEKETK